MTLTTQTAFRLKKRERTSFILTFLLLTTSTAFGKVSTNRIFLDTNFGRGNYPTVYVQNNIVYALYQQNKSFEVRMFDPRILEQRRFLHAGKFLNFSGKYYFFTEGNYLFAAPLDTRQIIRKWNILPKGYTLNTDLELEGNLSKNWNLISIVLSTRQDRYKVGYFLLSKDLSKIYRQSPQKCDKNICEYSLFEDDKTKPWIAFASYQVDGGAITTIGKETYAIIDPSNNSSLDTRGKVFKIDHGIFFSQKQIAFGCESSTTVLYIGKTLQRVLDGKTSVREDSFSESSPCEFGAIAFSDASANGLKVNVFSSEYISQSYKTDDFPNSRKPLFITSDNIPVFSHLYTTENYVILAVSEKFCVYDKTLLTKKLCFRNPYTKHSGLDQTSFVETKNGLGFYNDPESYSGRGVEINFIDFPK